MRKRRKILFTLISVAGFFLSFLIILLIVTPMLINLDAIKAKIKSQYTKDIGGSIEYEHLELALFPRPHVVVSDVNFTAPGNISGQIHSLGVYPKILPLFIGELQIGAVHSISPEVNIRLPESATDETESAVPFSFENLGDRLSSAIRSLAEFKIPSIIVRVRNGRVHFFVGEERILGLQSLRSRVKRINDRFEFEATCQSNFWESIAVKGQYEVPGFKISSQAKINQLRPHALADYFFPQSNLKMTNARANLTLDFQTDGPSRLQASALGTIPYMYWRHGNKDLRLNDTDFQFGFELNDNRLTLSVMQLDLKNPRMSLAGQLDIDPKLPRIQLDLRGSQINVATAQKIAVGLTENVDTVDDIFEILRGGEIQQISLKTQGPGWAHIADFENYVIQGSLAGGKIFIPHVQLNLQDVKGDATIANGILKGERIEARMGNSSAKKGQIAIALTEDTAPFHIEGLIQADLSQLPPILKRLVKNEKLEKELAFLKKFEGSAVGMLVIGEDTEDLNVRVTAADIHLDAVYQRIPYPLNVDGGNLLLDGSQITLTDVSATVGKSKMSLLSSRFGWEKASNLEISSKSASVDLVELHTWLSKNKSIGHKLRKLKIVNGKVSFSNFNLMGPLLKPGQWRLKSSGEIQNLSMSSSLLPGNLTAAKGYFTSEGDQFNIKNLNATVGKSTFSSLSAWLKWGKVPTLTAKAGETVIFLDEVYPWMQSHETLKPHVKNIHPLNGTLAFQNLTFKGPVTGNINKKLSLDGTIQKWDIRSPTFPTNLELDGGQLNWRGTQIDLRETDARFGKSTIRRLTLGKQWVKPSLFEVKADSADIQIAELYLWLVSFETLDKMFKGFTATHGRMSLAGFDFKGPVGHFKAWQFQLAGDLEGLALESDYFKAPIHINTAKFAVKDTPGVAGVHGRINLTGSQMNWEDSRIALDGTATFSANELFLDMKLVADRLNWGQVEQIADLDKKMAPGESMELLGSLNVESDNFTFENYTWQPMHADIAFNKEDTTIVIKKADLCGIQFPGIAKVSSNELELYFNPVARDQDLKPSISCLSDKKDLADGIFNLNGELMAKARSTAFPKSLSGNLEFTADQGRIYRFGMLAKIFALLNVTEIYRGEVPDLAGKGFAYNSMSANAVIEDGKLIIKESSIDSPSMGIACEGDIDLVKKKVDLTILVAPFKTVDRIVKHIPLVSNILGGQLITIPFRAKGELGDPDVIPLSPTAVGSGLLGIMERTLKLPITIIQPVLPDSKDKEEEEKDQRILQ